MKLRKIYWVFPLLGTLFCLWYIKKATCDIVYTDYIRLVNTYLPDVWNPDKFFVPDILTRIPIHYLGRGINTALFGFSTTFDMILGVLGLGLSGLVLGKYCVQKKISLLWYLLIMVTLFGLNKWEMLTNGSGWAHFLAFACFYYHYLVFDRVLAGQGQKYDKLRLYLFPFVITLTIAGPYCAVYSVTMLLFYGLAMVIDKRRNEGGGREAVFTARTWLTAQFCVLLPLLLYIWSNSYAVEDHAGAMDISLLDGLASAPVFFVKFLLKALASAVVGEETLSFWLEGGLITNRHIYLLGGIVAAAYLLAFLLVIMFRLYEETMLPVMLLVSGVGNHVIVLISRYIFMTDTYGMSSRYTLQYQAGILGILLIFALLWKRPRPPVLKAAAAVFVVILIAGQFYTNRDELKKAPHRQDYAARIVAMAVDFEHVSDDELRKTFDYRPSRPDSGQKVREALTILKEHNWNVFR